jgi:hypothetical protein
MTTEEQLPTPIPMEEYLKSMELLEMRCIPIVKANHSDGVLFYLATKGIPTADDVTRSFDLVDHATLEHRGKPLVVILHPDSVDVPED